MEPARTEFRPDPEQVRAARQTQRWRAAWLASLTALAGSLGLVRAESRLTALLGVGVLILGSALVGAVLWRDHRLGRALRDGHAMMVYPGALVLPGEAPREWSDVVAVVAHRLDWAGLEITLRAGRRVRLHAAYLGTTVDELCAAFGRHMPVGDPEAAYRSWGRYLNEG
ncbi:MAG: hypothetical protein HYR62_07295 [Actinobacteria bacterium]|nr:hypothetical protein [Actinomycetota bacterium]MBI3685981.1 hypothetical protein [Actinomycetota bacterium]